MMKASISITGLTVFGRHGVLPEETRLGQRFVIDLDVDVDVAAAVATDDYEQAVCYASLCDLAVRITAGPPFRLIETLAERIVEAVLTDFSRVSRVRVTVHKPGAPIVHAPNDVAVTIERRRMRAVGFSLGSNMGDRAAQLRLALTRLGTAEGVRIDQVSGFYRTAPWGGTDQPDYVNCVAIGETSRTPHRLLGLCKDIEIELGRLAGRRWGPRAIDIDLLYLGDVTVKDHVLTLPHPHWQDRAFVLVPLAEIAPDAKIAGRRVTDVLKDLPREPDDVRAFGVDEEDQ